VNFCLGRIRLRKSMCSPDLGREKALLGGRNDTGVKGNDRETPRTGRYSVFGDIKQIYLLRVMLGEPSGGRGRVLQNSGQGSGALNSPVL